MKSIIIRFIIFSFFAISVFIIFYLSLIHILNVKADFKLNSDIKILILGHSHPLMAYNDSIIPFTKNLAGPAESYLYTYAKTRKIIEQNPQINTVFIECSNNQFSIAMDEWTWVRMSHRLHLYGPFLDFDETKLLFYKEPKVFLESTSVLFRKGFEKILSSDYDYINKIGGYKWGEGKLEKEPPVSKIQSKFVISEININSLKKLISYLNTKNVKVFLIRTPTLTAYYNDYSEIQYQNILKTDFNEVEYLDFSNFHMKYSNYGDAQHMNYVGAQEYSQWFSILLNKGLLYKCDKQLFIDEEIKNMKVF